MLNGIDISEHQGKLNDLDFQKLKNTGIDFIIIRCGYTSYKKGKKIYSDLYFENNYNLCKKYNIPVGTYYYSCATSMEDATKETNKILELIKDKQIEYPIIIDTEDNHSISNTNYADESQYSIGKYTLTPVIKKMCNIIENNGYYVSIYASTYWFNNNLILNDLDMYDKWIAQWSNSVSFGKKYGIWQYTSTGKIDGINGYVDKDYSYIDYPTIMMQNGLNGYEKIVEDDSKVNDNLIVNDDVNNDHENNKNSNCSLTDCFIKVGIFLWTMLLNFIKKIFKKE